MRMMDGLGKAVDGTSDTRMKAPQAAGHRGHTPGDVLWQSIKLKFSWPFAM
ncbi:hypothetical protein BH10PSE11_BH10PSE11_22310 [soil metagenome]